jgi:hypothetical protein
MRRQLSGLWMVIIIIIIGLHATKNHGSAKLRGRAKLRLSRGRRANPGSDGASPYLECYSDAPSHGVILVVGAREFTVVVDIGGNAFIPYDRNAGAES